MRALKDVPPAILGLACERALETLAWFPEPVKLLDLSAQIIDEQRKAIAAKWLTDCSECYGSRFIDIEVDGVNTVHRCGCWIRAMQEIKAVGEPIKRPALPPVELV